jgi:hypothetical protein
MFIKRSATVGAAGIASVSTPSCIFLPHLFRSGSSPIWFPDMDSYLDKVDDGLQRITDGDLIGAFAKRGIEFEEHDALSKASLRTLFMTGMFGDLPVEGQTHPGMQDRMWTTMPEYDASIFGTIAHLRSLPEDEKTEIQDRLKHRSNPVMRIAEVIDEKADDCGVSKKRRLQTRSMLSHISMRMAHQPMDLFLDDVVTRCNKIAARHGSAKDVEKALAARMGEDAFQKHKARYAVMAHAWQERCGYKHKGTKTINAGAIVMGIGAFIDVIAGILLCTEAAIAGLVMFTPGSILLLAGMITLVVGTYKYAMDSTS